ncbi:MAG: hypothetical protein O3A36_02395 [bacterium]|nr:hypothetical protein [bacterium]
MRAQVGLQEKARIMRSKGRPYSEIAGKLGVSKSSISIWCRNVTVSMRHKKQLKKMALAGAMKGRKKWADMRRTQKKEFLEQIAIETKKDIGMLSKRDRFIAGLMLYAGEGDRTQERVGMSNSNPQILIFILNWWHEFLNLDRESFYAHLYLHVGLNEKRAKEFWMKTLRIKKEQFKYVYRPIPHQSHKKNIHEFGVCSVRINKIASHRKLMGWIRAVLDN